jgi:uncharacterized protein YggT (Ycf19 family)
MGGLLTSILIDVIRLYMLIIVVNAILSWFVHGTRNMTVRRIYWITSQLVDPALDPIRRLLRPVTRNFGIDISPFILIIFLQMLQRLIATY